MRACFRTTTQISSWWNDGPDLSTELAFSNGTVWAHHAARRAFLRSSLRVVLVGVLWEKRKFSAQ